MKNHAGFLNKVGKILDIKTNIKSFGTEDFSLYKPPKVFLLVGTGGNAKLHSDDFTVSDEVSENILNYWIKIGENLEKII